MMSPFPDSADPAASGADLDLVLAGCRVWPSTSTGDIGIRNGRIAALAPAGMLAGRRREDLGGRVVVSGFVDSHVHLDKACLICRCLDAGGGLKGAIAAVSELKCGFTVDDVYARGSRVLDMAIGKGTTHMRTHVEVDPRAGLRSFEAILALKRDYDFAIDLSICVFPQEGLTNDPGTEALLEQALGEGADLLGGCPYTDSDPSGQMERLFAMAKAHEVDLDFHLDFDLDPSWSHLEEICRRTESQGYGGRVAIGHVTKLAAVDATGFDRQLDMLRSAGVAVTSLPSTDLYLNGRDQGFRAVRGVAPVHLLVERDITASIATNNVLNPFTPFGDASLLRMANLYANIMHLGPADFPVCMDLVTRLPARLMQLSDYGTQIGDEADLIVLDATDPVEAFGGIAEPVAGYKRGRKTFQREAMQILRP